MIRLEPITRAWAEALAAGDEVFAARFGVAVEPGWDGFAEVRQLLVAAAQAMERYAWGPHLFFDDDGALVGNGGWKGAPVGGAAELGYAVAPARQGRGIATDVVRQFVERAALVGVETAVAHTLAEPSASTTVLERCGFTMVGEAQDPDGATVWRWELALTAESVNR